MTGARVVVIGAGVVGAALVDELALRGWDDVVLLDQGSLPAPGGSTSHAPGLVFQANSSRTMTLLARYTVEKFCSLSTADGPCFLQVGGLEVATNHDRAVELTRRAGWLASSGVAHELLDAAATFERYPLLDPAAVLGGLYTPTDGIARAVRAAEAQIARAASRGVQVRERHEVVDVLVEGGRVTGVRTNHRIIDADIVVCCAGIWGPKVAAMAGMTLPLTPLAHQLAWTTAVPTASGTQNEAVLPILRHQDHDLYFRERFDTIGIGYYGHRPMPVRVEDFASVDDAEVMPSVQAFTPDDFDEAWKQTQVLLPGTRDASICGGINGIFSFTTDNMPLLGQSPDVQGFWVAEAVWVTHSAGVGRAMAEWLVDGHCSSFDLRECDVNRFEKHQLSPDYVRARDCQNFVEVYDIIHPLQPPENMRPMRWAPFGERERELGAVFLEATGWERPQWYEANAGLVAGRDVPAPGDWAARYWSPVVAAEAQQTRESVALFDMSALKRLEVTGVGVTDFLQAMVTGDVSKSVGSVTYCLLLDVDGGIRSDLTVARLGREHYQLGANGNLDLDWLNRHLPASGTVQVRDITPGTTCIGLWGPRAREVMARVTPDDFSNAGLKYFRGKQTYLDSVPVTALRLSYVGELGWELYTTAEHGLKLWDLLWSAGADLEMIAAGRGAFSSLRLEKGYRSYGADMSFEHDPYEAGLGFAVNLDKGDFVGRDAVVERRRNVRRQLCCLTTGAAIVMGKEPVYAGDRCVGYVTSAGYGYTIGTGIAYAWLPSSLAAPGTSVEIDYFASRVAATVASEPLFDPGMTRLRG
jgi:glycine cleavage system aminomethyltransferase T/glycine/D-amino acid oxidase-like deaminating enzyme